MIVAGCEEVSDEEVSDESLRTVEGIPSIYASVGSLTGDSEGLTRLIDGPTGIVLTVGALTGDSESGDVTLSVDGVLDTTK